MVFMSKKKPVQEVVYNEMGEEVIEPEPPTPPKAQAPPQVPQHIVKVSKEAGSAAVINIKIEVQ